MESLFAWSGYAVHPAYETVLKDLVKQADAMGRSIRRTPGLGEALAYQ